MVMDCRIAQRVMSHDLGVHHPLAIFTVMLGGPVGRIVGIYFSLVASDKFRVAGTNSRVWEQRAWV